MLPTLASLVQHPALKLRVATGRDRLDAVVRWAQTSELADPTPYLDGGELLLTTALKLAVEDPEEMHAYVERLLAAGVVGVGFAMGVNHAEVPPALGEACERAGLPLLEVPRRTPFIAIGKAVSTAIAAEQYRSVAAGFAAQRELTRAALSAEGYRGLLEKLAAQMNGWAALYDNAGSVTHVAPGWAARRAARLGPEVRRLRDRPPPASAVTGGGTESAQEPGSAAAADAREPGAPVPDGAGGPGADRVELQSVGTGAVPRAVLAIGTEGPPGTVGRYAMQSAITVLTLLTERSRAFEAAERRLGGAVLHLLLSGEPEHARAVGGDLYGPLLDAPLRVLVAACGESEAESFGTAVEAAAARAGEAVLLVPDAGQVVVVAGEGGAAVAAAAAYARERAEGLPETGVVIGVSAPAGPGTADTAYRQARQTLLVARRRGQPIVEHDEVATGSVLSLLGDDAVRAFAEGALRPLREHDAHGRGDLVASLRAWLSRHGQWDAAAADLGVHRHTLRYRMRRVEEILDRSLDDPDARMELWLALKATER